MAGADDKKEQTGLYIPGKEDRVVSREELEPLFKAVRDKYYANDLGRHFDALLKRVREEAEEDIR